MAKILVVDDDAGVRFTLRELFEERGHDVADAASGEAAFRALGAGDVEAVVTDLAMPGMDGMALLRAVTEREPGLPVVMLTARGSERVAVQAMKAGAHDYLAKPFDVDEVALVVERAVEGYRLRRRAHRYEAERAIGCAVVGEAPAMRRLFASVARLAAREVPVLVRGETGTGKELVASLLHAQSRRAKGPLVRFNCAAIPAEVAEAELFGHAKGAFTGAQAARQGFFAQADGGTLVLDEVGELPLAVQPKLLRALQSGEIQPLGTGRVETVDVRVVACTHRDLLAEAAAGRFRQDLYYRLAVVDVEVPPLRERAEDVPALVEAFRVRYAARFGLEGVTFSDALVRSLAGRPWPGNVRELENAVARILALCDASGGAVLGVEALDARAASGGAAAATTGEPTPGEAARGAGGASAGTLREQVAAFERDLIARTLVETRNNHSEAARRLGVTRVTLLDKLKRHGL